MKNNNMPRLLKLFASGLLLATLATGCDNDDDDMLDVDDPSNQEVVQISGNATGAQEVPPVSTAASGTLSGSYNKTSNALQFTINWNGLIGGDIVGMHFHGPADRGVNAPVLVPITGFQNAATGTVSGSATVTEAYEADLLGGKWYYNIHTNIYPGGEIRGQVAVQ